MHFQIPQFIEIEDKIAGPLTLKQLLFLAGAGGIVFICFFVFQFWLWMFIAIFVGGGGIALAFGKYNGRPLVKMLGTIFNFLWKPRLYVWQRETKNKTVEIPDEDILNKRKNLQTFSLGTPAIKKLWVDLITTKNPIPKREKGAISDQFSVFRKMTGEKEAAKRVDYR